MFFASLDKSTFHVSLTELVLILPNRISIGEVQVFQLISRLGLFDITRHIRNYLIDITYLSYSFSPPFLNFVAWWGRNLSI